MTTQPHTCNNNTCNNNNVVSPQVAQTDQWCEAISSFGGKWATLVAKHECGFALVGSFR